MICFLLQLVSSHNRDSAIWSEGLMYDEQTRTMSKPKPQKLAT